MNRQRFVHFLRRAFADTWLAILVSGVLAGAHEYWIVGMPVIVIIQTRAMSCVARVFYGPFRDHMGFWITNKKSYSTYEYIVINTFCSILYNGVFYSVILFISRASHVHIKEAVVNVLAFSILTGAVYGLCLDYFRNLFDVSIPRIWAKFMLKSKNKGACL